MANVEFYDGFAWAVPKAFREALALCRFEEGDTLYDSRAAYSGPWAEGTRQISWQIQVKNPKSGNMVKQDKGQDSKFIDNWLQPVEFSIMPYRDGKARRVISTQGTLYTILWKGKIEIVDSEFPPLPPPVWSAILTELSRVAPHFLESSRGSTASFLLPYDETQPLLRNKLASVKEEISKWLRYNLSISSLSSLNLPCSKEYVPTMQLACFQFLDGEPTFIYERLKYALYAQKSVQKGVDQFKLEAHGHLITSLSDLAFV